MATLILEHEGKRRGGVLSGRMVIGRRPGSHVVIDDKSVSRIHAWVGRVGHTYFVADSGSRTGTIVNGRPVEGRRTLRDGDEILIGPARIVFHADDPLPPGLEPLSAAGASTDDEGTVIECKCGAPMWVAWDAADADRRCVHCGNIVASPHRRRAGDEPHVAIVKPAEHASPAPRVEVGAMRDDLPARSARVEPSIQETTCGACQSAIGAREQTTSCPECGVTFHANCWTENRGCSSYGCKQVGILDSAQSAVTASAVHPFEAPASTPEAAEPFENPRQVQWSYLLLPASGLAGLAGMFGFGVPSLALLIGLVWYSVSHSVRSRGVFAGTVIFSAVAAAAGAGFSTYWWLLPAAGVIHR